MAVGECPTDGEYRITKDFKADTASFAPIESFSGYLHGAGHVIKIFTLVTTLNDCGIFQAMDGTIDSLGFDSVYVKGGHWTGTLVGHGGSGTIRQVYIRHGYVKNLFYVMTGSSSYTGGIAGQNAGSVISSFGSHFGEAMSLGKDVVSENSGTVEVYSKFIPMYDSTWKGKNTYKISEDSLWAFWETWLIHSGATMPLLRAFMNSIHFTIPGTATYDPAGYNREENKPFPRENFLTLAIYGNVAIAGEAATAVDVGTYTAIIDVSDAYQIDQRGVYFVGDTVIVQIVPAAVSVIGVKAENKTYDETKNATLSGTDTARLSGVFPADTASLRLTGTPAGEFEDAEVGSEKQVTVSGYAITGDAAKNYVLDGLSLYASILAEDSGKDDAIVIKKAPKDASAAFNAKGQCLGKGAGMPENTPLFER